MRSLIRGLTATLLLATLPLVANAELFVSVSFGPPLLPVYLPPPMPAPGYIWVPGYWAWDGDDYYWVPGTWVLPPEVGLLWTPGYWGWASGVYVWHAGYWGPEVGFYGGIDYGCGYDGVGYRGGFWRGSTFVVNNTAIHEVAVNRVAFNGGAYGVVARPTAAQIHAAYQHHVGISEMQLRNEQIAARDESLRASINHGRPPLVAIQRPSTVYGRGVVTARTVTSPQASGMPNNHRGLSVARPAREPRPGPLQMPRSTMPRSTVPEQAPRAVVHQAPPRPMMQEQVQAHAGGSGPFVRGYSGGGHAAYESRPHDAQPGPRPVVHQAPPRPMMQEQVQGHAGGSGPLVRGGYSGGGHAAYESRPHGAPPVNGYPQGHVSNGPQRPAEHGRAG